MDLLPREADVEGVRGVPAGSQSHTQLAGVDVGQLAQGLAKTAVLGGWLLTWGRKHRA